MDWSLTKPSGQPVAGMAKPVVETVRESVILARMQDLVSWGRKHSVWPFNFGLSCCFIEMATSLTSKYDLARFGSEVIRATPPRRDRTMHDIETLINHFLNVSWGPIIPKGEAFFGIEGSKGAYGYFLISDGNTMSYRTRIRTPSFPHMQMLPVLSRGVTVSDLLAILGSMDYVLADVDR